MCTVSPLTFDFNRLEVTVEIGDRKLTLVGSLEHRECKMINGKKLQKLIQYKGGLISHLYSIQALEWVGIEAEVEGKKSQTNVSPAIIQFSSDVQTSDSLHLLLAEFKDLFDEANSLPPQRPLDHSAHLKPHSTPVNIRAYIYSPIQKVEIEKQVSKHVIYCYHST